MKIKLTNYPYQGYQIGEIVDFGDQKNKSLVSFGRAVWVEEGILVPVIDVKKTVKKAVKKAEEKNKEEAEEEIVEEAVEAEEEIKEEQPELVETEEAEEEDSGESNSFWGKFKSKKQSE